MSTQAISKWSIDQIHSEIHFKVKHLMINTITGSFKKFEGSLEGSNEDFADAKISFAADINNIDTGVEYRDTHLKGAEFFNAEKYPQLKFESTAFEKIGDTIYLLKGNITILETTLPIQLDVEYGGKATDFYGNTKAGFEISGKLKRKEFGLTWDGVTETGGIALGNDVKLALNVQLQLNK